MSNLFDVLTSNESEDERVRCQSCGHRCPIGMSICEECGEPVQLVTLAEWGQKLPVGIVKEELQDDKTRVRKLVKDFSLDKLDFQKERNVSDTWTTIRKRKSWSAIDYVINLLSHVVLNLAGQEFQRLSHDKRMYVLSQMVAGDVFYMYCYLRYLTMGHEFTMTNLECWHCGHVIDQYTFDLGTLEVATIEDIDELEIEIELQDGLTIDRKLVKKFSIAPMQFSTLSRSTEKTKAEAISNFIVSCVSSWEGMVEGRRLVDSDLLNPPMSAIDMSIFEEAIDRNTGGPRWTVDVECPKCQEMFSRMIDWDRASFFRHSSRSRARRRRSRR